MTTAAYKNDVEIRPVGSALCEHEQHDGGGGDECIEIAGRAICRDCLIDALDQDRIAEDFGTKGFDIKEDQHPALAYLIANPLNLLPPPSCTSCPFYLEPDCSLLHKRLDDATPICTWPQWQDAIRDEVQDES